MTRGAGEHTAWLDELFEGGLSIPAKSTNAAMTLLITGPPGTGKSTICLELCYRLAKSAQVDGSILRSLYFTTEGHAPWLIAHAREFGWDLNQEVLGTTNADPVCVTELKTAQDFQNLLSPIVSPAPSDSSAPLQKLLDRLYKAYFGERPEAPLPSAVATADSPLADLARRDLLVFDNLNTLRVDKGLWFQLLADLGRSGPRLVIVVLDSPDADRAAEWECLADVVIRMRREASGYLIRTIEIVKSRYQLSALGRHQVKINKAFPLANDNSSDVSMRMRHHPFREEGGIFIYPSMHFVLSRHKYLHPTPDSKTILPVFSDLAKLLSGGFHAGRCIAFTGGRGTHKSRLAFAQLLYTLRQEDAEARAIVISLGDDELTTSRILEEIDREQFPNRAKGSSVNELIRSGRLEIAYYPPGFITPEEFFHRLQLSIARNRKRSVKGPLLLVFNSLNLLHSHFPLCAEHKVFIPAVVELLGHQGVTSFFVTGTGQAVDEYGLLSLADPILEFTRLPVDRRFVLNNLLPARAKKSLAKGWPAEIPLVRMEVARFAAGTSAGEHAFLALAAQGDRLARALGRGGLHFWLPHPKA
jgi:KaiC/GvpD/RAD55 family RecA-like ATPase